MKSEISPITRQYASQVQKYRPLFEVTGVCPSLEDAMKVIPVHCFVRSLIRSMMYAIISVTLSAVTMYAAYKYIPLSCNPLVLLAWVIYAFVEGTILTGCWVVAHECGHGAFCDNGFIQDTVGFLLHSALMVPYFSWQRSHGVHHSRTNHMTEGETHVPNRADDPLGGAVMLKLHDILGETPFGVMNLFNHLVIGWPVYLMFGFTGGPARGISNHFLPFNDKLFPGKWKAKVLLSDVGVLMMCGVLFMWARAVGSWVPILALYFGPYLIVNMWLVLYTWLQHTEVDIPHYDESNWTWIKGVFATVDRPYGAVINFLHHGIGSTHVAHHLCSRIPHYHAWEVTRALQKAFPRHYLFDPTPIVPAMWRVARNCVAVTHDGALWVYISSSKQAIH